jgi:hypothetical protein
MATAGAVLKSGDAGPCGALAAKESGRPDIHRNNPEWHSLRLFGGGRHPGVFLAGAERKSSL